MLETEPIELVGTLNVGKVEKGTNNYDDLINKPVINDIQLDGNLSSADLGLQPAGSYVENETDPVFSASPSAGITSQNITNWNNKSDFSGNYNDLTNKPDLSQFITKSVNDLTNYYLKSETYTKNEVNSLIGAIQQFHYEIVQELPQTGATNILYLVPKSDTEISNVYDEYVYANNNWEKIGDTQIDLSNYVTTSDLNTALADYTTTTDLTTLLSGKQDTLVSGTNIKTINNTSILGTGNISISSASTIVITSFDTTTLTSAFQTWFDNYVNNNLITGIIYTAKSYSESPDLGITYFWNGSFALSSASQGSATYHCDFMSTDWSYNLSSSWIKVLTCNVSYNWQTNTVTSVTIRVDTGKCNYYIPIPYNMKSTSVYRSGGLVLTTDNTVSFTPTRDYHPATKKYVDDNSTPSIFINSSDSDSSKQTKLQTFITNYRNGKYSELYYGSNTTGVYFFIKCTHLDYNPNTKKFFLTFTGCAWGNQSTNYGMLYAQNSNMYCTITVNTSYTITNVLWEGLTASWTPLYNNKILATDNTTAFTPTGDYNPATKKYVDDLVGNISTVLESLVTVSGGE